MRAFLGAAAGVLGGAYFSSRTQQSSSTPLGEVQTTEAYKGQVDPLSPKEFRPFHVIQQYDESHDTKVLRFALPEGDMTLGMTCASCILLRFTNDEGKEIVRPYTPISSLDQQGYFDLMIKKYPNAQMGTFLFNLKKNQTVDIKGPFEKIKVKTNQWKRIGLIAGGTGITPCYQVAQHVMKDPKDETQVDLIYANKTKADVLLGNELHKMVERYPRFSVYHTLSNPHDSWVGGIGFISKEMIKAFMPPPAAKPKDSIIMVCGPPAMMEHICGDKDFSKSPPQQGEVKGLLKEMGYNAKQVFKF